MVTWPALLCGFIFFPGGIVDKDSADKDSTGKDPADKDSTGKDPADKDLADSSASFRDDRSSLGQARG